MSVLEQLREQIKKDGSIVLLDEKNSETKDISLAKKVSINNENYPLDLKTEFIVDETEVPLKVIIYCWLNRDMSAAELLNDSTSKNIQALSFLQRNDLVNWLKSVNDESQFIKSNKVSVLENDDDPLLKKILSNERDLIDHNSSLRGFKPVDFYNVGRECEIKIIKQLKRNKSSAIESNKQQKTTKTKPIILISPAASALLSLTNIKPFLENSTFIDSNTTDPKLQEYLSPPSSTNEMRNVTHEFPRLNKKFTFLIVNNLENFTRPEYWDRVIAIFTTGQTWQFKNYKWSKPKELFQHIKGYYFFYNNDPIPASIKEWNVEKIKIDRQRRFKDAEVLNYFWDSVEKSLVSDGF